MVNSLPLVRAGTVTRPYSVARLSSYFSAFYFFTSLLLVFLLFYFFTFLLFNLLFYL